MVIISLEEREMKNKFTIHEWHSWVIGWSEVMCPSKPRIPRDKQPITVAVTEETIKIKRDYLQDEYHYYGVGRVAGVFTCIGIIVGLAVFTKWWFF